MTLPACDDWAPTAAPASRRQRASAYRAIRSFFEHRDVLEVETPLLSTAATADPQIESFCAVDGDRVWYLRTSPEFPLKRLLASDWTAVYELGRVFRRGEAGRWHNPEFTMLEWYRPGMDDRALSVEVVELVNTVRVALEAPALPWRTLSCRALLRSAFPDAGAGADAWPPDDARLGAIIEQAGWGVDGLSRADALELVISLAVRKRARDDELLIVHDFPVELAALAECGGASARRFEVFAGTIELANGYHELRDAGELERRFEGQLAQREVLGRPAVPIDRRLIAAQRSGLPDCAGVALGVDRLLAWATGGRSIAEVINFPADRA